MMKLLMLIQMLIIAMSVIQLDRFRKEVNNLAKAHLDLITVFQAILDRGRKSQ